MNKEQRTFKKVIKRRRIAAHHRWLNENGIEYGKPRVSLAPANFTVKLSFWQNLCKWIKNLCKIGL